MKISKLNIMMINIYSKERNYKNKKNFNMKISKLNIMVISIYSKERNYKIKKIFYY